MTAARRPKEAPGAPGALRVQKVAGEDGMARVPRWDPDTGEKTLVSPLTGRPLPRPLLGVRFVDGRQEPAPAPERIRVPEHWADREDWVELVNPRPVHRPKGPPESPWREAHTFVHCDAFVLHMLDGDYRYDVVRQPDKYGADGEPTDAAGDPTASVDRFYDAVLAQSPDAPKEG